MRKQYQNLISKLIDEIDRMGCVEWVEGEKTIQKHDRTASLKNLLTGYKLICDIYPEETEQINIQDIRKNL